MTSPMASRLLALSIGTTIAALIAVWWMRSPPTRQYDIALRVVDQRGAPIERFGWSIGEVNLNAYTLSGAREIEHPGGMATVRVSSECDSLEVRSDAFHGAKFSFARNAIPSELEAVLTDLGLVRGVVTHGGVPVAGARVELLAESPDPVEGVPSGLFYGYDDLRATTDSSGAFSIGSDFPNAPYFARACTDGLASGIVGPVRVGDPPIEIKLADGGTIEGLLRLGPSGDAQGKEVVLYRDEYGPDRKRECGEYMARADSAGRFRFEHVQAGLWLVKLMPPNAEWNGHERIPVEFVPFVVEVREGEATSFDMDLTQPVAHLDGDLRLNGKPWTKAFVYLREIGERAFVIDMMHADDSGRWTVRARAPGKYRLIVWGDHEHSLEPSQVSEIVELPLAGSRWERDVNWRNGDPAPPVLTPRK